MSRRFGGYGIRRGVRGVAVAASTPAAAFTPASRSSDLVMWLRGGDWTLDGSSNVQTWSDLSPQGNDFSNTTLAQRPPTTTIGSNSVPAANFSSSAHGLAASAISGGTSTSHTLYVAWDMSGSSTSTTNKRLFDFASGRLIDAYATITSGQAGFFDGTYKNVTTQASIAKLGVIVWKYDAAATTVEMFDGTSSLGTATYTPTDTEGATAFPGASNLIIAGPTFSGTPGGLGGDVAEVVRTNKADSSAEISEMVSYLKARVGIA